MMTASYCDCLICRLEASLIAELSDDRSQEEFRLFTVSSTILSAFPTASELIQKLATTATMIRTRLPIEVLLDLLSRSSDTQHPSDVAATLTAGLHSDHPSHHNPDHGHLSFIDSR